MRFKPYAKKETTIEALRYTGDVDKLKSQIPAICDTDFENGDFKLFTPCGMERVSTGDYIIRDSIGYFYRRSAANFEAQYTPVIEAPESLPHHMQRVYLELKDLTQRQISLQKYIAKKCLGASKEEVNLLHTQLANMFALSGTLRDRLSLHGPAPSIKVSLVYARSSNGVFGQDGKLPWHDTPIKEDFEHFKDVTIGKRVVMGSKTFDSLGRKPLPHRRNYIITSRMEEYDDVEDVVCFNSLEEMLNSFRATWVDEVLVIGGSGLLSEALKYADTVYETVVDKEYPIQEDTVVFDPNMEQRADFKLASTLMNASWGSIRVFKRI